MAMGEEVVDVALRPNEALGLTDPASKATEKQVVNQKMKAKDKEKGKKSRAKKGKRKEKGKRGSKKSLDADIVPELAPALHEPESELRRQQGTVVGVHVEGAQQVQEEAATSLLRRGLTKCKKQRKTRTRNKSAKSVQKDDLEAAGLLSQEEPQGQAHRLDGSAEDVKREEAAELESNLQSKKKQKHRKNRKKKGSSGSSGRKSGRRSGAKQRERQPDRVEHHLDGAADETAADFCGDFFIPLETTKKDFACLGEREIVAQQSGQVESVAEVLSISSSSAVALLKRYKWCKDRLLTAYFDDPEATLASAGVPKAAQQGETPVAPAVVLGRECTICAEEFDGTNAFSLEACRHVFCLDCWEQYLTIKITEGSFGELSCPHSGCSSLVPRRAVEQLVEDGTYTKYCQFMMHSFVDDNERVRWCPAASCGRAVRAETVQHLTVDCACGFRFCFLCSKEDHRPATCAQVRLWKKKCQDESETTHWIAANTQECPKCQLPTEKNGGCNHMICRQCKHEYCWVCFRDWKGHSDFYSCNRIAKLGKAEKTRGKKIGKRERERQRLEMRKELERYLFHHTKFIEHSKCRESDKIQASALRRMKELQETEATAAEVQFIEAAASTLHLGRNLLKYSYVRRFYLESDAEELFAFVQEGLETAAEELAEALGAVQCDKTSIIDLTQVLERRCRGVLAGTAH